MTGRLRALGAGLLALVLVVLLGSAAVAATRVTSGFTWLASGFPDSPSTVQSFQFKWNQTGTVSLFDVRTCRDSSTGALVERQGFAISYTAGDKNSGYGCNTGELIVALSLREGTATGTERIAWSEDSATASPSPSPSPTSTTTTSACGATPETACWVQPVPAPSSSAPPAPTLVELAAGDRGVLALGSALSLLLLAALLVSQLRRP